MERHEAANAGVQVMATVTAAGPETSPESLSLLHRYNALQQEHEKLKVQVAQVTLNATTGEAELTVLRGRVLELTGRNGELAGQVVTLEADAQELRAAAAQMSADLERLEQDNAALQQDVGRKRQRLDGQEQALAMAAFMGRALYQEYLLRRAALEQTHAQTGPRAELLGAGANAEQAEQAEQPLAATKPARYIALHGVTADTGGRLHRIVRDLNRNTIDSIGQNLAKWGLSHHPTHAQKRRVLETILDYSVPHMPPTYSSVSWRKRIYLGFKRKFQLRRSTDATLREMHGLARRANDWFRARGLPSDYLLVEQQDLEALLHLPGLAAHVPDVPHPHPLLQGDIRAYLQLQ